MGVHGLWSIIAPAGHTVPLSRLAGRTLAVDLSGWVCQAVKAKSLAQKVQKPHLRNLFFRVSTLYRLGASLVFVIDGEATQLKWGTLDKREGRGEEGKRKTGRRTILQSYVNECCNLLDSLGVPYIRSRGEAEALCSILNYTGMADGVLTNDSDSFLYGATTVYRDLHTTERSPTVECYTMKDIHEKLALNRSDLIALALLLGCDYCPQGVMGVGKETALQFLRAAKSGSHSTSDVLDQFQEWRNGSITEDDIESKIELTLFRKAMSSPNFPQKEVIREFLRPPDLPPSLSPSSLGGDDTWTRLRYWRQPLLHSTQVMCRHHLKWPLEYTAEKMVPLMSQWAIRNAIRGDGGGGGGGEGEGGGGDEQSAISPYRILKSCKLNGEKSYRVQWQFTLSSGLETKVDDHDDDEGGVLITVERQEVMEKAFPAVCSVFRDHQTAEAQLKEQAKALSKKHRHQQKVVKKTKGRRRGTKKSPQTSPSSTIPQILQDTVLQSPHKDTLSSSSSSSSSSDTSLADTRPQTTHLPGVDDDGESEESPIPCLSQRLAQRRRKTNTNIPRISLEKQTLVQTSLLTTARVVRCSNTRTLKKHRENPSAYSPSKNSDLMESHITLEKPLKYCCSTDHKEENEAKSHAQLLESRILHSSENPQNGCSSTLIPKQEEKGKGEVLITPPSSPLSKRVGSPNVAMKVTHSPKKLALTNGGNDKDTSSSSTPCIVLSDSNSEEENDEYYDVPLVERLKRSMASRNGGKSTGCRSATSSAQGTARDPIVL